MAVVKRILVQPESGDGVTLSGKTGSAVLADKTHVGWFVGALSGPQGHYVFALDYRGPDRNAPPGLLARDITLRILRDAGLLAGG